jgi:photosystem II stability/assembly factor-like uncharacterized protein
MKYVAAVTIALMMQSSETLSQSPWTIIARPTPHDLVKMSFLDSLNGWVCGDSGTILRTTNGGHDWIHQNSAVTERIIDVYFLNDRHGWALAHRFEFDTTFTFGTRILSTTNGGDVWQSTYLDQDILTSVYFRDSLTGFIGSAFGKFFKTSDGGTSWLEKTIMPGIFSRFPVSKIRFYSDTYGFAVGGRMDFAGVIWRTTDAGETWSAAGIGPEPLHGIHYFDSLRVFTIGGDGDYGSGLVTTTNGGLDWEYTDLLIWGEAWAVTFRNEAEGWAPLGFASTYMFTLDSGNTWTDIFTPDSVALYDAIFTDERTGYMVGARGTILKYSPVTTIEEHSVSQASSHVLLHQNYPNPFNPATHLAYTIAQPALVTLTVYDLLGREVATLVNDVKQPGTYEVTWDASADGGHTLSSGVYFCQLRAGSFVAVKKLLLIR